MRTSDTIEHIATALAKAQGEFKPIPKNKTGKVSGESKTGKPYSYEYKYAALPDVLDGIKGALASNGLAIVQATEIVGAMMVVRTRIVHTSGQFMDSEYPVCSISGDHQKMGGAVTYARRYALTALVGVAADEDVDGAGADHVDPADAVAAVKAKAKAEKEEYAAKAKTTLRNFTKQHEVADWWNREHKNRQHHFDGDKKDPLYIEIYDLMSARNRELAPKAEAAE